MLAVSNRSEGQSTIAQGLSATGWNAYRRHTFAELSLAFREAPGSAAKHHGARLRNPGVSDQTCPYPLMFGPRDYQHICYVRVLCTYTRLRTDFGNTLFHTSTVLKNSGQHERNTAMLFARLSLTSLPCFV